MPHSLVNTNDDDIHALLDGASPPPQSTTFLTDSLSSIPPGSSTSLTDWTGPLPDQWRGRGKRSKVTPRGIPHGLRAMHSSSKPGLTWGQHQFYTRTCPHIKLGLIGSSFLSHTSWLPHPARKIFHMHGFLGPRPLPLDNLNGGSPKLVSATP